MPNVLYHGSPRGNIKLLHPPVFATPRRGLAIFFSIKGARWKNIKRVEDHWTVIGLTKKQLSQKSYLYYVRPTKEFSHLAGWQYISHSPIKPYKREIIPNVGAELRLLGIRTKSID